MIPAHYQNISSEQLPQGERLHNTVERVLPYWRHKIVHTIQRGQRVLICTDGNSLHALVKHFDHINDRGIINLNIPNRIPRKNELDSDLLAVSHRYIGEVARVETALKAVAREGKAK